MDLEDAMSHPDSDVLRRATMNVQHADTTASAAPDESAAGRRLPTPSTGWTGTIVRLLFGVIWAVDAYLKWLPGYRHDYISNLKQTAQGQPSWLHWWFHFWINLQTGAPSLFATLTGLMETALALVLLLGIARRAGYTVGAVYALLVWAVGEGFGGPYMAGSTDVGTGIVYTMMFIALLVFSPPARRERLGLDHRLVQRWRWWRFVGEPHAVDRVHGAPLVEPVVVGEVRHD
jgi:thiosulfate dehydrogenase (quinone) large subunit